jgi:hypothetical protein
MNDIINTCGTASRKTTWRDHIRWKLFPWTPAHCPEPDDKVKGNGDVVIVNVITTLSFGERLKVLCSGRIEVQSRIATEHVCGATKGLSVFNTLPPKWLDRQ